MLRTGNWIIPTLHGKLYLTKPPLMNWLIAASGQIFGGITKWLSRLPSVLAMMEKALVVYFMTRMWLDQDSRFFYRACCHQHDGPGEKGHVRGDRCPV